MCVCVRTYIRARVNAARGRAQLLFQLNISAGREIGPEKYIDLSRLIGYRQMKLTLH